MKLKNIIKVSPTTTKILGLGTAIISAITGILLYTTQDATLWIAPLFLITLGVLLLSEGITSNIHLRGKPSNVLSIRNIFNLLTVTVGGMIIMGAILMMPMIGMALVPSVNSFIVGTYGILTFIGGILGVANLLL